MTPEALARRFVDAAAGRSGLPAWDALDPERKRAYLEAAAAVLSELQRPVLAPDRQVLEIWREFCLQSTGVDNEYVDRGTRYRILAPTGRLASCLKGSVVRVDATGGERRVTSYQIDADGRVLRGPAILRRVAQDALARPVPVG